MMQLDNISHFIGLYLNYGQSKHKIRKPHIPFVLCEGIKVGIDYWSVRVEYMCVCVSVVIKGVSIITACFSAAIWRC